MLQKSLLLLFEKAYLAKEPTYLINNALAFLEDWQGINSICLKTSSFVLKEFLNRKKKSSQNENLVHILPYLYQTLEIKPCECWLAITFLASNIIMEVKMSQHKEFWTNLLKSNFLRDVWFVYCKTNYTSKNIDT